MVQLEAKSPLLNSDKTPIHPFIDIIQTNLVGRTQSDSIIKQ